ncbi:MAG: pyrroloquinoline quinone precursor peptide PqqA [Burkholderiales bacterium]|nr:pyrroloquinoline quinone precursor peptide PqqA [Burkholderiales bacterium]
MKIMSCDSWSGGWPAAPAGRTMRHGMSQNIPAAIIPVPVSPRPPGDSPMQWQTPTAVDFRFGFEITLYVSAR